MRCGQQQWSGGVCSGVGNVSRAKMAAVVDMERVAAAAAVATARRLVGHDHDIDRGGRLEMELTYKVRRVCMNETQKRVRPE